MQDVNKLRFNHVLDLRDWDLSSSAGLIDALDLSSDPSERTDNFFEAMPAYIADPFLAPSEAPVKVAAVAEDNVDRARFMVILGVVLAAAALGLLVTAITVAARIINL